MMIRGYTWSNLVDHNRDEKWLKDFQSELMLQNKRRYNKGKFK